MKNESLIKIANVHIYELMIDITMSRTLWYNTLYDVNETRQTHLFTICRSQAKDGVVLWQFCVLWLRVVIGRLNQSPKQFK